MDGLVSLLSYRGLMRLGIKSLKYGFLKDLDEVHLGGHHVEASVLFADIVGFTSMSEKMSPKEVNALLNEYFNYIALAANAYNGHIDKYIGDCAMLVFGVPEEDPEHSFHAVGCAILIQRIIESLNIAP